MRPSAARIHPPGPQPKGPEDDCSCQALNAGREIRTMGTSSFQMPCTWQEKPSTDLPRRDGDAWTYSMEFAPALVDPEGWSAVRFPERAAWCCPIAARDELFLLYQVYAWMSMPLGRVSEAPSTVAVPGMRSRHKPRLPPRSTIHQHRNVQRVHASSVVSECRCRPHEDATGCRLRAEGASGE